ncbi:MAG: cystathionine beta-lyase [Gemmatimonadota bacterium]|nr:MAG: cystathionine beta-lyase [Gemmatimonadota bacterium]
MSDFHPVEAMAAARHEFGEHGGVNLSVEISTTFTVMDPETMPSLFTGQAGPKQGCYLYGRHFNPTVYALGRQLAAMEGTEAAYCTSSGMGAIAATAMQLCRSGDHAVVAHAIYGGTYALFRQFLPGRAGVHTTFVDPNDLQAVEAAFTDRTRMLYVETMANPTLAIPDLPRLAEIAHRHGARLVVDNTFCPLVISPAQHGADIVVHSLTKYAGGASDVIGGAICAREEFLLELMDVQDGALMLLGPTMDPTVASHLTLRLPLLPLRMKEHSKRAQFFAERLHAAGVRVVYPGLESHPNRDTLHRLGNREFGAGGILTVDLGTRERADALMGTLQNDEQFGYMAVSLGYFETLMSCPSASTSSELTEEEQRAAGISPGLVRMSVGLTGSLEQRWGQLERALRKVGIWPQAVTHSAN